MPPADSDNDAPRVLFVTSSAFNKTTGGGVTFTNLFRGWPRDAIATVHNDSVPVTDDVCSAYFKLGPAEIGRWPRVLSKRENPRAPASLPGAAPEPHSLALRKVKATLIGNTWPDTGRLSPALEAWIEAYRPQVLYTILGTIGMMELVDAIRTRFKLPMVVHFMDDWPSHIYRGGALSIIFRQRMRWLIRRLVGAASERMAIGSAMAQTYSARYHAPFSAFQNPINMGAVVAAGPPAARGQGSHGTRVLYIGSIFDNAQAFSLIDLARCIARLAADGHLFQLEIYSPLHLAEPFRDRLEVSDAVRLHDAITDDDLFIRMIRDADILVLPVNFDQDSVRLIRYSMPTKLPAYLASGTPVLVYGPPDVAQVDDALRHEWGLVVADRSLDRLASAFLQLATDPVLAKRLSSNGRRLAKARHDADVVRSDFKKRLILAAKGLSVS